MTVDEPMTRLGPDPVRNGLGGASCGPLTGGVMAFRPNMTAFTDGIRPVSALRWRRWDGVVADLWEAEGVPGGGGHYYAPDPRIVVFLGEGPAPVRLTDRPGKAGMGKVAF